MAEDLYMAQIEYQQLLPRVEEVLKKQIPEHFAYKRNHSASWECIEDIAKQVAKEVVYGKGD